GRDLETVRDPPLDFLARIRQDLEVVRVLRMDERFERDTVDLSREALELAGDDRDLGHARRRSEAERDAILVRADDLPLAGPGGEPRAGERDVERELEIVG